MSIDLSDFKGLSHEEVEESRRLYGYNILTPPPKEPWWKLLLEKFDDPIIRILIIAALIAIIVGYFEGAFVEGGGIIVAILLATLMSFINEYRAGKEFDILNEVNDDVAVKVIRNGNVTTVQRRNIVVNDLVIVDQGEEVAADGIILKSVNLVVNESTLTGEPVTNKSELGAELNLEATFPSNFVYKGTTVIEGNAVYRVTAIGNATEIGKTAQEASIQLNEPTPLSIQLTKLSKLIGVIGFFVAAVAFWVLLINDTLKGIINLSLANWFSLFSILIPLVVVLVRVWMPMLYDFFEILGKNYNRPSFLSERLSSVWFKLVLVAIVIFILISGLGLLFNISIFSTNSWFSLEVIDRLLLYFMVSITLIVVAVPEGLAMSVTLSLAYSMRKMTANNNLVRHMHSTETMGATTVICTDKTGTLTQNRMSVTESYFYDIQPFSANNRLKEILLLSVSVNTNAHLDFSGSKAKPVGNPTDAALLLWLLENSFDYRSFIGDFNTLNQLPFSSENKFMATFGFSKKLNTWYLFLKGAPEVVERRCSLKISFDGSNENFLEEETRERFKQKLNDYQERGMRTIAFAYKEFHGEQLTTNDLNEASNGMVLLGIVGISDPVRSDISDSIAECKTAGIDIKVITGDTIRTAKEICRQINLIEDNDADSAFVSGADFAQMDYERASSISKNIRVLYRARPTDKLKLVQLLQQSGEVVAVTGDGTNDAPALNKANVGLAMGSGTSVAREASDIILLDDSFASIVSGVRWGRTLYLNIQRFLFFQLTINLVALAIVLCGPAIGVTLPLTVIQMLWVNLIMDTFAALALATGLPTKEIRLKKPRKSSDFILSTSITKGIVVMSVLFFTFLLAYLKYLNSDGDITRYELTLFFNVFVFLQFWNLFNARVLGTVTSALTGLLKNKSFLAIILAIFLGQILIVEFGGSFFRTTPLSLANWLVIVSITSIVLWLGEIYRLISRIRSKKQ